MSERVLIGSVAPFIGAVVQYQEYGRDEVRAAIVTFVWPGRLLSSHPPETQRQAEEGRVVSLCILHPRSTSKGRAVTEHLDISCEGYEAGQWHWPETR